MAVANTVGVILAGGRASRMGGGDKGLLPLAGRPVLDHVIKRLRPQVSRMILNASGDPARFARWNLAVVADTVAGPAPHAGGGPLAGVLAAMRWTRQNAGAADILSVPTDTPFLPADLAARLWASRAAAAPIALAASGGRLHPVIGLWSVALEPLLARALAEGERRVGAWALSQGATTAEWACRGIDPFLNLNRPEDLAEAERRLRALP